MCEQGESQRLAKMLDRLQAPYQVHSLRLRKSTSDVGFLQAECDLLVDSRLGGSYTRRRYHGAGNSKDPSFIDRESSISSTVLGSKPPPPADLRREAIWCKKLLQCCRCIWRRIEHETDVQLYRQC